MRALIVVSALVALPGMADDILNPVVIGDDDAPYSVQIQFSAGCSHCVTFFEEHARHLRLAADRGQMRIELLDVPGLVDMGLSDFTRQRATFASFALDCIAMEKGADLMLEALANMGTLAREAMRDETALRGSWATVPDTMFKDGVTYGHMGRSLLSKAGIEEESCDQDGFVARASPRLEGAQSIPDYTVPRVLVDRASWDYAENAHLTDTDTFAAWLVALSEFEGDWFDFSTVYGLVLSPLANGHTVDGVKPGGLGDIAGLEPGDIIVSYNDSGSEVLGLKHGMEIPAASDFVFVLRNNDLHMFSLQQRDLQP